jgi:GNAT superfamily N-acetyltransferase
VIEEVSAEDLLLLRSTVLRPALPIDAARYDRDDDAEAHHLAVRLVDGRVVGSATFFPDEWPGSPPPVQGRAWRLRGMATAPEVRGTGTGGLLLQAGIDLVSGLGARLLWCEARTTALGFYARYDFQIEPDEFPSGPQAIPHHRAWRPVGEAGGTPTARP